VIRRPSSPCSTGGVGSAVAVVVVCTVINVVVQAIVRPRECAATQCADATHVNVGRNLCRLARPAVGFEARCPDGTVAGSRDLVPPGAR
jgi:hypothetical protein